MMRDYISREAARNALYEADAITMKGVAIMNQFPAADVVERPRWIPVTERLPEEKHAVLVWEPKYLNSYVCFLSDGEWYVFGGYGVKVFGVTHWMPLPEPPKEEEFIAPPGKGEL